MIPPRFPRLAALTWIAVSLTTALAPAGYVVTDLGSSGDGGGRNADVNNLGQVAWTSSLNGNTAFRYSPGTALNLGTLGGQQSFANGINDLGQVVGGADTSGGQTHAFLYSSGKMKDLGVLGTLPGPEGPTMTSSSATAINNAGQVVGSSSTNSGQSHAFLYSNGAMKDLGVLGNLPGPGGFSVSSSEATAINAAGQVVGQSSTATGMSHAFLYSNGKMTDLGALGGQVTPYGVNTSSMATGINNAGQIVGSSSTSKQDHAFLYSNGKMTDLGTLGGFAISGGTTLDFSAAASINKVGQLVGWSTVANGQLHAFLYANGKMTDLNTLLDPQASWTVYGAVSINDAGQIVALGARGNKDALDINPADFHTLLLTPDSGVPNHATPEPGTLALCGLGALSLAAGRWRRRFRSIGIRGAVVGLSILLGNSSWALASSPTPPAGCERLEETNGQNSEQTDRRALRYAGRSFEEWREYLQTELKPELRQEAIKAMGCFGSAGYGPEAARAVLEAMRDVARVYKLSNAVESGSINQEDILLISTATQALRRIGPAARPALRAGLRHPSPAVRQFAISCVPSLGEEGRCLGKSLVRAVNDSDPYVAIYASSLAATLCPQERGLVAALGAALASREVMVRAGAAKAFAQMGKAASPALVGLLEGLHDPEPSVRAACVEALTKQAADPRLVMQTFLHLMTGGQDGGLVRQACISYFASLGPRGDRIVTELATVLKEDDELRESAFWALGNLGPAARSALPALKDALAKAPAEHRQQLENYIRAIEAPGGWVPAVPPMNTLQGMTAPQPCGGSLAPPSTPQTYAPPAGSCPPPRY